MSTILTPGRVCLALCLGLLASASAAADQPKKAKNGTNGGKKVALLVAVNDCNHDRFPALRFAENDLEELALQLQKSGFTQVRVLSNTRGSANAKDAPTAANIRAALAQTFSGRGRHDTVLVALAGHGLQMEVNDPDGDKPAKSFGYFCPADTDLSEPKYDNGHSARLILLDQLINDLGRCAAGNRMLFVDAGRVEEAGTSRSLDTEKVTLPRGVAALFSCGRGQTARESEKLGKGHGLFFYSVLESLRGGGMRNEDGEVTWDLLSAHVKRRVATLARPAVQVPHAMTSLVGDPVLARVTTLAKVVPSEQKKTPIVPPLVKVPADKTKDNTPAATVPARKVALLIGVREHDDPKFADLRFTENDAEEMAAVLKSKSGGFDEVMVLTTTRGEKDATARPTVKNIRAALAKLTAKLTKEDLILVGYSGHGVRVGLSENGKERDEPFLVPGDGQLAGKTYAELSKTLISVAELVNEVQKSSAGTRLFLIDAGRMEVEGRSRAAQNLGSLTQVGSAKVVMGTSVLFSCSSGERAFETPKLGKGHGLFFFHVLEGLRGQAKNERGEVTWARMVEYVSEKVAEDAPKLIGDGAKQTPHEIGHLAGRSPLLTRVEK